MVLTGTKHSGGFSLIELMTVIAIIAILAGIGALSVRSMRERYEVEKTTKDLYSDLMNTRVLAMQQGRAHFVVFAPGQYVVYADTSPAPDGNGSLEIAADGKVESHSVQGNFTLSYPAWPGTGADAFHFNSQGLVPQDVLIDSVNGDVIHVVSTANSAADCLIVTQIRIAQGKWNGTTCDAQ